MSDSPAPPDDERPTPDDGERVTRILRTFASEHTLWPVGLVVFLSAISFGALMLVMAIRARSFLPGVALLLLIFLTVYRMDPDIRARRLRPTSILLLAWWAGSALVAFVLAQLGAF